MRKADDIRYKIANLEDDIACMEVDYAGRCEIDAAYCRLADLRDELREEEEV